jgi:hypothetical protein
MPLTDKQGNKYLYDRNYAQVKYANGHSYIITNPDDPNYNYGFFILPDGTY